MLAAIHDQRSSIDVIKGVIPQTTSVAPNKGLPIITNTSLYTTSSNKYLSLTQEPMYPRKEDVPSSDKTLFTTDHKYPDWKSPKDNSKRYFRMDFIEFSQRIFATPINKRTFYGYIEGDDRKPYFDLEYEFKDEDREIAIRNFDEIIKCICVGIQTELRSKGVNYRPERDCIILSSHGPNKRSIHIIINNFYFKKCGNRGTSNVYYFAQRVRNYVPKELWYFTGPDGKQHETIDMSVYSSGKEFRLIWNTKMDKNRYFDVDPMTGIEARFPRLDGDPVDMDENLQRARLFEATLITAVSNCKPLPDWAPVEDTKKVKYAPIDMNNAQEVFLLDAFNSSKYADIYRIDNNNERYSSNSFYLIPITKPYFCDVHQRVHDSNNVLLCYSSYVREGVTYNYAYIHCLADGSNSNIPLTKDAVDVEINNDDDEIDVNINPDACEFMGNYCIKHGQGCQQKEQQSQQNIQQRVPAQPIINCLVPNEKVTAQIYPTNTFGGTADNNNRPIIKIETTSAVPPNVKEGQMLAPCTTTSIDSFLNGNTKFIGGNEYIIQDLYDAYEKYRCGQGKKYNLEQGHFGRALTSLGHFTDQKKINGKKVRVVILKRPNIPLPTTNPVEALNKISGNNIATIPALKPDEAVNLLEQNKDENIIAEVKPEAERPLTKLEQLDLKRPLNKHRDVPNCWNEYVILDPEAEVDLDNLFMCFEEYCNKNRIILKGFGKKRLIRFLKNKYCISGNVIKGYRCKVVKFEEANQELEARYRKIWQYNTTLYHIGWHNGKDAERYDKRKDPKWRRIDIHYHNDEHVKSINQLIEMTNQFEKNLPDRVKEIQLRQLELLYFPYDPTLEKECNNLKTLLTNVLAEKTITENSEDYLILKRRIDELQAETLRVNREESIKDDKARLRDQMSWCITVRSTFCSGKTFNLRPFIEAFPEMKVLIVLPRISLTDDYMREYRAMGFEIYTDTAKGKITGNRIIVCFPSLPRVRGEFDLLVLDEYKAIKDLQHTLLAKNTRKKDRITGRYKSREMKCYQALCQYVAKTKRVYVADALLTNAHVLEIAKMRGLSDEFSKRITVYQNFYQKYRRNIVYTVDNRILLVHKILKFLREGKRVAVPTNSKDFADFLYKQIMKSDLNVTISLSTSEHKATAPIALLWANIQCVIYTPTILAGNSYPDPIYTVCGFFVKRSCDQADSLQMLMRCRNVTSKEYYICVEKGPGKSPIPSNIYPSFEAVKKFFMNIKKNEMKNWSEEYILPMDMIEYDHIHDTIKVDDMYFNSYVNFMKQGLVADHEYLFRMLLYMRDAGFLYGGNIYTKTDDKETIAVIKQEKKEFTKEKQESDLEKKYKCADLTTKEYSELNKKTNKTKDDVRRLCKYQIKRKYNVNNVPKWLFKVDKKYSKQYERIKRYQELNGVIDQKKQKELMITIAQKYLGRDVKEKIEQNQLTSELLQGTRTYNAIEDIELFWTERDIRLCEYSLMILKLIGAETFIRDVPRFEILYNEFNNIKRLKDYIVQNEGDIREIVNDFKISIDNLASKVTNKAFGIEFKITPFNYTVNNIWIKNPHNLMSGSYDTLWPYNYDLNDKEELKVLIPEPTLESKAKFWTIRKQAQVSTPPKVPPITIMPQRIQAKFYIDRNLKLL